MPPFFIAGIIILCLVTALWVVSLRLRNASIADIFWGIGFIVVAWLGFALSPQGYLPRKLIICILVTLWGIRLSLHIGKRNHRKPEDFRYAAWRTQHGMRWWWLSYFQVFFLQGFLLWIISTPVILLQTSRLSAPLTLLDLSGASLFVLGLVLESIADSQLTRFKSNPANKGKLLTTGLWRYSRHPNYFGEAVVWWGVYLVALSAGFWWVVFSPILMTWLLLRVSGVAMLERAMQAKPGYEEYMNETSAFVPWFRKHAGTE